MKVLMSTLIALSVLATLSVSATATVGNGKNSRALQERLKNCFPALECQRS